MAKNLPSSSQLEEALEGIPVRIVDAFNLWSSLCIAQSIPLGRLEWIWNNRGNSVRESSLTAKAVFRLLDPPDLTERSLPARADQWFKRAYCHLLLVPIEELAAQRESPAWQYVRKFVEQCREKRFEYIVGVVADSETDKTNRKLMERVRTETNLSRRERVVNVPALTLNDNQNLISHLYHSPPHQELLIRLRECTRDAVEVRVQQYEAELERLYPKRANPDWSFCYFFSVKEAMGFVFCQLGRRDMALRLLDELHAFMVEYDEKEGTRSFCNETPCVAAASVSDIAAKDYQKLFTDNTITELEMRTYLFAIRTEIMLPDRKHSPEIAERGLKLITAVSRRCIEEAAKNRTAPFACFRDAWVFTAARNLAATLSPAIPPLTPENNSMPQLGTPKERHTARLLAGFQVHALKSFVGLAKIILPGTMTQVKDGDKIVTEADKIAILDSLSDELRDALASPTDAEIMYAEIANSAATLYEMGGRSRGAAALDGDAGVIRLRNGSLSEAEKLLQAQCSRYTDDHSWDDLHLVKRKDLALAEKSMDKVQEYLVSCLTILFMTRSSRKISVRTNGKAFGQQEEKTNMRSDVAEKWVKEAYETAGKLPRVMKYKAEKLLNVYMKPGVTNWFEGDPGKATVVIQSDIPADIRIDSLFVEFRNAAPTNTNSTPQSEKKGDKSTDNDKAKPRVVTMKSLPVKLIVKPGVNEMTVSATEIPWAGRYAVNLVALFIGKLKLVQVAPKPDSYPIVHIKGTTSQKEALTKVANSVQQPDIGKPKVRFPAYFSRQREMPVRLNIAQNETLFLVQGAAQRISVEAKSDLYGIDTGAKIILKLKFADNGNDDDGSAEADEGGEESVNILQVENLYETNGTDGDDNNNSNGNSNGARRNIPFTANKKENGLVEVIINTTVSEGVTIVSELSVLIPAKVCDNGAEKHSAECTLEVALKGRELASSAKRQFECRAERSFEFINPIKCSTRTDLHAKSVTAAGVVGMDEEQNVEGGMLLCTIQNTISSGNRKQITLRKASLELPHWLKLRDGTAQPHEDLLPFGIHQFTRFVFGFDILVCGTPTVAIDSSSTNFSSRRYSRRSVDSNHDGMKLEGIGFGDDSPSSIAAGVNNINVSADSNDDRMNAATGNKNGLDASRSADLEFAVQQQQHDGFEPMEGVEEDVEMTDADADGDDADGKTKADEDGSTKESNNPKSPEVGDVVDLSGGPNNNNGLSEKNKTPAGMYDTEFCGKLRLEFLIDGIPQDEVCHIDRVIHLHELRPQRYSYIIKRVFPQTVTAGENVEFCFCISMTKNTPNLDSSSLAEEVDLQYEIRVRNEEDWIVSGRKRGNITINNIRGDGSDIPSSALQKISLLPLTSGRILMPTVQLYDSSGRNLPENAYENLNECMQVVVLPSTHVTSVCVEKEGDVALSAVRLASSASLQESRPGANNIGNSMAAKSNMPQVVAFDSFFDL